MGLVFTVIRLGFWLFCATVTLACWLIASIIKMTLQAKRPVRRQRRFSPEYLAYIRSWEWAVRSRTYRAMHPICEWPGCRNSSAQTHHRRYGKFDGREPDSWLMALCVRHHRQIHGR